MYVSLARLQIPEERAPELVAAFRRRAQLVEEADGFFDLQVWQSDRNPGELVMVSRWRDRRAFKAYMKSERHRISHDRIDPVPYLEPTPLLRVSIPAVLASAIGAVVVVVLAAVLAQHRAEGDDPVEVLRAGA